jgi:peptide/nickel transport system substrate-binding protein
LRRAGITGASFGAVSLAGCSGNQNSGQGDGQGSGGTAVTKAVGEDLPEERRIKRLPHYTTPKSYWAERYQAVEIFDKRMEEELGFPIKTKGLPIPAWPDYRAAGRYGFWSSNWCSDDGDPDNQLVQTYHSEGGSNITNYENKKYDEVATKQRRETDREARKELVFECQRILGEDRPESQVVYNYRTHAFNNQQIEESSVVTNFYGLRNVWNLVSMEPKNEKGKVVVTNNFEATKAINPLKATVVSQLINRWAVQQTHDFLYRLGPKANPKPWAAKEHEWKDDTTLTVTLKDGLKFHDGESLTVDDVVFTFNLILNKKPPAYKNFVNDVLDSVERSGDKQVTFNLPEPYAPFRLATLARVPILPRHFWEATMEETGQTDKPQEISFKDRTLVASGPFKFGAWDQGSKLEFPAFKEHPHYAPNIDKRIERNLGSREAEIQALRQGEYTLMETWFGSPKRMRDLTEEHDSLTMTKDLTDCRMALWSQTDVPPLDDVAMRQAVNAVILGVQPVIIEEVFDGLAERATTLVSPALDFWHNDETPTFGPGTDAAIAILKDAGYKWDEDGNLYAPEGKTIEQPEWA